MASFVYNQFAFEVMNGTYNLAAAGDTVKTALMATGHSASTRDDDGWASVSANELGAGGGYTTGGETMASKVTSVDDTDDEGVFDSTVDETWTSATFSAYYAVIYDDTPASPLDPLICSIDFGGVQTVSAGTFTITWAAEGIVNITTV